MNKIKCENCDYYQEVASWNSGYCRMQDKKIPLHNEKTRCKHFRITDLCFRCKFFRSWVTTSQGEINRACVDEEKRTMRRCSQYNHPERCPEFISR